jgi:hypothetical protein
MEQKADSCPQDFFSSRCRIVQYGTEQPNNIFAVLSFLLPEILLQPKNAENERILEREKKFFSIAAALK